MLNIQKHIAKNDVISTLMLTIIRVLFPVYFRFAFSGLEHH